MYRQCFSETSPSCNSHAIIRISFIQMSVLVCSIIVLKGVQDEFEPDHDKMCPMQSAKDKL